MRCLLTLARGILAVLLVASSAAAGEVAKPVPAEAAVPVPSPGPSSSKATPVQAAPAPPPDSRIDTARITARANQELGANIDQTVAGWQRELDAVENDLHRAHLRYTELNHLRDELHRVRAGIDDLASRLRSPLEAVNGRLQLLGPVPGAGHPAHVLVPNSYLRTELRIAILDAFNEAGVVLASGQTDVTIANPSWLREMIVDHFGRSSRVATPPGNGQGARTEVGSPAS